MRAEGQAIVVTGGASGLGVATERAFGMPLDQVHAECVPVLPRRVAAVA